MKSPESSLVLRVPKDLAVALKKLHPIVKSQIRTGLNAVLMDPFSGKALKDELQGLRSFRVKRYRIIYRIPSEKRYIEIVAIGPRSIIYEETFRLINK